MDITKLRPEKMSPYAEEKIITDFFPDCAIDNYLTNDDLSSTEMEIHAGAFCLYAATLMTKVFENNPESISYDATDRENALKEEIKKHAKFSSLTDEEITTMAKNMIIKDIRNCFAHGNFEISFDKYTKKVNYVLKPRRKDFVVDKPIVISKQALLDVNKKHIEKIASKIISFDFNDNNKPLNLSESMKKLILPTELLKMSEYYLNNNRKKSRQKLEIDKKKYSLIHYILMVTKITYEQDDYYNIFGKDSKMFEKIAHIRNSIAHDGYSFANLVEDISYDDRDKNLYETVQKSLVSLKIANDQKSLIMRMLNNGYSEESVSSLTYKLEKFFEVMFCGVKYSSEDFFEKE